MPIISPKKANYVPAGIDKVALAKAMGVDAEAEPDTFAFLSKALDHPLPEPWTEQVDSKKRVFYWNPISRQSSWHHPLAGTHKALIVAYRRILQADDKVSALDAEIEAFHRQGEDEIGMWRQLEAPDGTPYFYKVGTQTTRWDNPRDEVLSHMELRIRMLTDLGEELGKPSGKKKKKGAKKVLQAQAAIRIQRQARATIRRKKLQRRIDARIKIQSLVRGFLARRRVAKIKKERTLPQAKAKAKTMPKKFVPAQVSQQTRELTTTLRASPLGPPVTTATVATSTAGSVDHLEIAAPTTTTMALAEKPSLEGAIVPDEVALQLGMDFTDSTDQAAFAILRPLLLQPPPDPWYMIQRESGRFDFYHPGMKEERRQHPLFSFFGEVLAFLREHSKTNFPITEVLQARIFREASPQLLRERLGIWEGPKAEEELGGEGVYFEMIVEGLDPTVPGGTRRMDDPRLEAASNVAARLTGWHHLWTGFAPEEPFPLAEDRLGALSAQVAEAVCVAPGPAAEELLEIMASRQPKPKPPSPRLSTEEKALQPLVCRMLGRAYGLALQVAGQADCDGKYEIPEDPVPEADLDPMIQGMTLDGTMPEDAEQEETYSEGEEDFADDTYGDDAMDETYEEDEDDEEDNDEEDDQHEDEEQSEADENKSDEEDPASASPDQSPKAAPVFVMPTPDVDGPDDSSVVGEGGPPMSFLPKLASESAAEWADHVLRPLTPLRKENNDQASVDPSSPTGVRRNLQRSKVEGSFWKKAPLAPKPVPELSLAMLVCAEDEEEEEEEKAEQKEGDEEEKEATPAETTMKEGEQQQQDSKDQTEDDNAEEDVVEDDFEAEDEGEEEEEEEKEEDEEEVEGKEDEVVDEDKEEGEDLAEGQDTSSKTQSKKDKKKKQTTKNKNKRKAQQTDEAEAEDEAKKSTEEPEEDIKDRTQPPAAETTMREPAMKDSQATTLPLVAKSTATRGLSLTLPPPPKPSVHQVRKQEDVKVDGFHQTLAASRSYFDNKVNQPNPDEDDEEVWSLPPATIWWGAGKPFGKRNELEKVFVAPKEGKFDENDGKVHGTDPHVGCRRGRAARPSSPQHGAVDLPDHLRHAREPGRKQLVPMAWRNQLVGSRPTTACSEQSAQFEKRRGSSLGPESTELFDRKRPIDPRPRPPSASARSRQRNFELIPPKMDSDTQQAVSNVKAFLSRTCGTMQFALKVFDPSGDGRFDRSEWENGLKKLNYHSNIDPQALFTALDKRQHHTLTLSDLIDRFSGMSVFTGIPPPGLRGQMSQILNEVLEECMEGVVHAALVESVSGAFLEPSGPQTKPPDVTKFVKKCQAYRKKQARIEAARQKAERAAEKAAARERRRKANGSPSTSPNSQTNPSSSGVSPDTTMTSFEGLGSSSGGKSPKRRGKSSRKRRGNSRPGSKGSNRSSGGRSSGSSSSRGRSRPSSRSMSRDGGSRPGSKEGRRRDASRRGKSSKAGKAQRNGRRLSSDSVSSRGSPSGSPGGRRGGKSSKTSKAHKNARHDYSSESSASNASPSGAGNTGGSRRGKTAKSSKARHNTSGSPSNIDSASPSPSGSRRGKSSRTGKASRQVRRASSGSNTGGPTSGGRTRGRGHRDSSSTSRSSRSASRTSATSSSSQGQPASHTGSKSSKLSKASSKKKSVSAVRPTSSSSPSLKPREKQGGKSTRGRRQSSEKGASSSGGGGGKVEKRRSVSSRTSKTAEKLQRKSSRAGRDFDGVGDGYSASLGSSRSSSFPSRANSANTSVRHDASIVQNLRGGLGNMMQPHSRDNRPSVDTSSEIIEMTPEERKAYRRRMLKLAREDEQPMVLQDRRGSLRDMDSEEGGSVWASSKTRRSHAYTFTDHNNQSEDPLDLLRAKEGKGGRLQGVPRKYGGAHHRYGSKDAASSPQHHHQQHQHHQQLHQHHHHHHHRQTHSKNSALSGASYDGSPSPGGPSGRRGAGGIQSNEYAGYRWVEKPEFWQEEQLKGQHGYIPRPLLEVCKTYGHIYQLLADPRLQKIQAKHQPGKGSHKQKLTMQVSVPQIPRMDSRPLTPESSSHDSGRQRTPGGLSQSSSLPALPIGSPNRSFERPQLHEQRKSIDDERRRMPLEAIASS